VATLLHRIRLKAAQCLECKAPYKNNEVPYLSNEKPCDANERPYKNSETDTYEDYAREGE